MRFIRQNFFHFIASSKTLDIDETASEAAASEVSHLSLDDLDSEESTVTGEEGNHEVVTTVEDRIKECIDNASDRNTKVRSPALKTLYALLCRNYVPDLLMDWLVSRVKLKDG